MSSIKEVDIIMLIIAERYYDQSRSNEQGELEKKIGHMVLNPYCGLKIVVSKVDSQSKIFQLKVQGKEAVSWTYLDDLVRKMRRIGTVVGRARDINDRSWENL